MVLPKIAANWNIVAINLDFDISTIKIIQKSGRDDPEDCCLEMLTKWLTTGEGEGPKTWNTLLSALKLNKKFTNVCSDIQRELTEGMLLSKHVVTM